MPRIQIDITPELDRKCQSVAVNLDISRKRTLETAIAMVMASDMPTNYIAGHLGIMTPLQREIALVQYLNYENIITIKGDTISWYERAKKNTDRLKETSE